MFKRFALLLYNMSFDVFAVSEEANGLENHHQTGITNSYAYSV